MEQKERVYFHRFLAGMRSGKKVSLEQVCSGICSASMLARIEAGERLPEKLVRDRLLERLGIANGGFEDYLPVEEYERWQDRQELLQAIADRDVEKATGLIGRYEQEGSRTDMQADKREDAGGLAIERQFYLAMKADLMQYQGASQEELCAVYREALELTMPPGVAGKRQFFLSAKEWNLLVEYIHNGGNVGSLRRARTETGRGTGLPGEVACPGHDYKIQVYSRLLTAIEDSDMEPAAFAGIYPKVVCYLLREQMQEPEGQWDCAGMLDICARAVDKLRSAERLYYLCELLEEMEQILVVYLGGREQEWIPFQKGSLDSLLVQVRQWRWALAEVYREYGMPEQMQNCCYLYWQFQNYCIGDVVRRRRRMLGLSVKELCEGICSEKTLRRLENNRMKTQMPIVMDLFERLGLPTEYQRKEIVMENYEDYAIYNTMIKALNNNDTNEVDQLLEKLKSFLDTNLLINRQEIQHIRILNEFRKQNVTSEEAVSGIRKTMELTLPWQAVQYAVEGYMTCGELGCLYNIAMKTMGEGKEEYIELLTGICEKYVFDKDVKNHIDMYELIMNGVASYLGDMGQYEESNRISVSIIRENLSLGRMGMLHMSLYNILWNKTECKKSIKNIPVEPDFSSKVELQKCMLLAGLCKDFFYEKIYSEKLKHFLD